MSCEVHIFSFQKNKMKLGSIIWWCLPREFDHGLWPCVLPPEHSVTFVIGVALQGSHTWISEWQILSGLWLGWYFVKLLCLVQVKWNPSFYPYLDHKWYRGSLGQTDRWSRSLLHEDNPLDSMANILLICCFTGLIITVPGRWSCQIPFTDTVRSSF